MVSFPLQQRAGVPRRGIGTHPLLSSTACVQDASWRVFRLAVLAPREHGLRLRVSAGLRPASPTTGVQVDRPQAIPSPRQSHNLGHQVTRVPQVLCDARSRTGALCAALAADLSSYACADPTITVTLAR